MAKDRFERTKPHLSVGTFRAMGISQVGSRELLLGLPVSSRQDRILIAAIVASDGET